MLDSLLSLFYLDALAGIMITLVTFIGICIASFAHRYLKGDTQYRTFFVQLTLLLLAVAVMVSANHLALLLAAWCVSNILLVRLMVHKPQWPAAQASGILAARNHLLGIVCVALAFALLYSARGETHIQTLVQQHTESPLILPALLLLLIGALTQSAIWPFHRWLTSSLNSPTPVSALMHAGLVNGGGFLLTRFAPLYLDHADVLSAIFVIGITSALLGTLWKLMQNDVKRMLACSTLGQMGFMLAQCGLGLFQAAIAHLVWHGLFKAYLFLASGSAAQERRYDLGYPPKLQVFIGALVCGGAGTLGLAYASGKTWFGADSSCVLMVVAFMAASQFALPLLRTHLLQNLPLAIFASAVIGLLYGSSMHLIALLLAPMQLMQPQALNSLHILGMIVLTLAWLALLFLRNHQQQGQLWPWMLKGYVLALNASQPHPATVTTQRNHYQYL